jgi:hypothetical protein
MSQALRRRGGRCPPGRVALLLTAFLVAGCSSRTAHVSGKVLLRGQPLPGGTVTFFPTNGQGTPASAQIEEDGTYDMPKAPVGPVKITVANDALKEGAAHPPIGMGPGGGPVNMAPRAVQGKNKAGEAGQGAAPKEAIERSDQKPPEWHPPPKPPGKYVEIADKYKRPETSGLAYEVKPGSQDYDVPLQ